MKIAFVHFGKCAGIYTNFYLTDKIFKPNNYSIFNGWHEYSRLKLEVPRDFTEEELLEISVCNEDKAYCHNHHICWTKKSVSAFNNNNWLTFTFLRKPENLICSLFFWAKRNIEAGQSNPLTNVDIENLSLNNFIDLAIERKDLRKLWVLPDYIDKVKEVEEFSDISFDNFLKKYFNLTHDPKVKKNTSGNKGFNYYYKRELVEEDTKIKLASDVDFIRYKKYLKCTI